MNLDWRCDTRICRSQPELYRNHTNGIQEIQLKIHAGIQCACLLLCHFHCHQHCPVATNKQWDFQARFFTLPLSLHKRYISLLPPSAACKSHREADDGELVCFFVFFAPVPNVFSLQPFSIKFQFCWWHRWSLLSPHGDNSPLLCPRACKCHREANNGELIYCFHSLPPFPILSHISPFQLICYSVSSAGHPPSVDKVNNSPLHPSPAWESCTEGSDSELSPPLYFPPPFPMFSHCSLFQLHCCALGSASCLPSV